MRRGPTVDGFVRCTGGVAIVVKARGRCSPGLALRSRVTKIACSAGLQRVQVMRIRLLHL